MMDVSGLLETRHGSFPKLGYANIDPNIFYSYIITRTAQNGTPNFGKPLHILHGLGP